MSEENLEIYRRHVAAFNDDDLDAIADLMTEDFEFIPYLAAVVRRRPPTEGERAPPVPGARWLGMGEHSGAS